MSKSAEKLLEFGALKEIVSRSTTCAPGRRATEALVPRQDRPALEMEFALLREAIDWLRTGFDLGFGSLADPDEWLNRLGVIGAVLEPAELLEAVTLMESAAFRARRINRGFSPHFVGDSPCCDAQW